MKELLNDPAVAAVLPYVREALRLLIWVPVVFFLIRWVRSLRRPVPALPPQAVLINQASRDKIYLTNNETLIGRSTGSDIVLNFPTVSRNHAVIACRDGEWFVYDAKSKAGVEVNGKPIEGRAAIRRGDRLSFGGVVYLFSDRIVDSSAV